jgi:hypothetical protein
MLSMPLEPLAQSLKAERPNSKGHERFIQVSECGNLSVYVIVTRFETQAWTAKTPTTDVG